MLLETMNAVVYFGFALPAFVARSVAAYFCFFAGMATYG
jgi:hypothetical protein